MVGRKRMVLLTNELDLSEQQLAQLYASRWGVEVFFRTVKQSCERAKLLSRTPANVEQEIQWTLLGIWFALSHGAQAIPPGRRLSPVQVFRVLGRLVSTVSLQCVLKLNLQAQLAACVLADESSRRSGKSSHSYPRKKRRRTTGKPSVKPITETLNSLAIELIS